jgi:hypothetical protein
MTTMTKRAVVEVRVEDLGTRFMPESDYEALESKRKINAITYPTKDCRGRDRRSATFLKLTLLGRHTVN